MRVLSSIFFLVFFAKFSAQNSQNLDNKQFYVEATAISLKSTHGNYFNGGAFLVGKDLSKKFNIALGVEHSGNNFHNDNDWLLYKLRFYTIVTREQFQLFEEKK